jgi:hypothetical protein
MTDLKRDELGAPKIVDRAAFQAELDRIRVREKAHTHEGDAIAAARRRLPMVEVDPTTKLIGQHGPLTLLDAFEGRRSARPHTGFQDTRKQWTRQGFQQPPRWSPTPDGMIERARGYPARAM